MIPNQTQVIEKTRFGRLDIGMAEVIEFPLGLHGFPDLKRFCLVDPGDDTLILWMQSLEEPEIAFPILEPKIFRPDYVVRLSGLELRELQLQSIGEGAVFTILTIPGAVAEMTANLKAPIVINLKRKLARQVVLQENEYALKTPVFRELRAHLVTLRASMASASLADTGPAVPAVVSVAGLSAGVGLQALSPA